MSRPSAILQREDKTRHISLPPVMNRALTALAERAGHGNASRIVQELVTRESIFQFGPDWTDRFSEPTSSQEDKVA